MKKKERVRRGGEEESRREKGRGEKERGREWK